MKKVNDLACGSPSTFLQNQKDDNRKKIEFARQAIGEIEEFLEQYRKYLTVLERVQSVLDAEVIEDGVAPPQGPEAVQPPERWSSGLDNEDWNFLLQCSWKHDIHKQVISLLEERNNQLIPRAEIEASLKVDLKKLMGNNFLLSMKSAMRRDAVRGRCRYRFVCIGGARAAQDQYQIEKKILSSE